MLQNLATPSISTQPANSCVASIIFALLTSIVLAIATIYWVPLRSELVINNYYLASLFDRYVRPRSFTGTWVRMLDLSPQGFILYVQLFKLAWLMLLSLQFFIWIRSRLVAFSLSAMFAFISPVLIDNAISGQINMVADFWLLVAASLLILLIRCQRYYICYVAFIWLFMVVTLLTHEKNIFALMILLVWAAIKLPFKYALLLAGAFSLTLAGYFSLVWNRAVFGFTPKGYLHGYLRPNRFDIFLNESGSAFGIFTSIGLLWAVLALFAYFALRTQANPKARYIMAGMIVFAIMIQLAPLMVALDTQRMVSSLWVFIFLLIADQAAWFNQLRQSALSKLLWLSGAVVQILIPPSFIVGKEIVPINCYSVSLLTAAQDMGCPFCLEYGGLHKEDVECKLQCPQTKACSANQQHN